MISRADMALLAVSLLWGGTFVVVKEALRDVSTFLFLALRFTLAAGVLALALGRRIGAQGTLVDGLRLEWRGGAACAGLLFLGYALQTAGLTLTTASKSAFLTALYIVLVPLLASFVNESRPRPVEVAGILLAACGTALLTAASGGWQAQSWDLNRGDMLTILSALAFAGHILAVAHYSRRMAYERLALYQIGGVAVFSWLARKPMEPPRIVWSAGAP
ncbi:MAG: DMT family transporter, partial [Bryobacteraceae bacterium]|nr:DMT family transporter [Bryobacteraceae bacterium]